MPDRSSNRWGPLGGSPYYFLARRPFREARLRAYMLRQHQLGRSLVDVVDDAYARRCGTRSFRLSVMYQPETLAGVRGQVIRSINDAKP
jgi:hypothetical protein